MNSMPEKQPTEKLWGCDCGNVFCLNAFESAMGFAVHDAFYSMTAIETTMKMTKLLSDRTFQRSFRESVYDLCCRYCVSTMNSDSLSFVRIARLHVFSSMNETMADCTMTYFVDYQLQLKAKRTCQKLDEIQIIIKLLQFISDKYQRIEKLM